uniref:Uncharacterized protein n=1 Tax=Octopus bimaculoides TaxID=37653 RepID=A0A0L8HZ11_OCTBM
MAHFQAGRTTKNKFKPARPHNEGLQQYNTHPTDNHHNNVDQASTRHW